MVVKCKCRNRRNDGAGEPGRVCIGEQGLWGALDNLAVVVLLVLVLDTGGAVTDRGGSNVWAHDRMIGGW